MRKKDTSKKSKSKQKNEYTSIPKRFKLLGNTIEVIVGDERFEDCMEASGLASFISNEIFLRPLKNKEKVLQIFWHELTHFILYYSGSSYKGDEMTVGDNMTSDEGFVDLTAALLHQAVTTFEY